MTRRDGNVIDKIQAELAETKRREDELRRQRRDMFRSQPDLRSIEDRVEEGENLENNGNLAEYSGSSDAEVVNKSKDLYRGINLSCLILCLFTFQKQSTSCFTSHHSKSSNQMSMCNVLLLFEQTQANFKWKSRRRKNDLILLLT